MLNVTMEEPTEESLKGIILPPMPATLTGINSERAKAEPSLGEIARLIERDISVAGAVIKAVNSPLFGLRRKLESISQAVFLLGLDNVVNLVTALSLRSAMQAAKFPDLDRFFDSAQNVAIIMSSLAGELCAMPHGQAYLLGLFHDCGIPLLFQKHPEYLEVMRTAKTTINRSITAVEDERIGTDHALVGYFVARSWKLPNAICLSIRYHHSAYDLLAASKRTDQRDEDIEALTNAAALLAMAEIINYRLGHREEFHDWDLAGPSVLAHFDLTPQAFELLEKDTCEKLADA
ncbi:MAG: HDOD domain-containing protein [Nitrospirae bacterium]|nr:MAG: HDOD domain-containing protein [Nitrospirota bacterium]